ncbi:hypothetical protein MSNKSG1_05631 [Marinobacter santoriniensis NKSG1]|uniref:Acyl-CoA thioesterase n=1 Tax=Marinobacter santoriniensis NKSG1 TaxID=1288826 RepID=M7CX28_9GAMM|nr:thioesterase family protein [Marinobacter santoriniensis]EMP56790.1 hypothetical protein MSNKSG1_05631 [Marinobacter santoriniensis NKSG1]
MTQYCALHPLDQATSLESLGDDRYRGRFPPSYFNMVGPFGGVIASTLLNAVLSHPKRHGDPVSMTINFAGPVDDTDYEILARPARTNRSTQHWTVELIQHGQPAITGTVFLAIRRDSWEGSDIQMPEVPEPAKVEVLDTTGYRPWMNNYEFRVVDGHFHPDGSAPAQRDSHSTLWMRDEPPRPLDFLSLMALSDCFFPRIFIRQQQRALVGTVSMTTYFHGDAESLRQQGSRPLLGVARAQRYFRGYFDQVGELWGEHGELLASTHQIVYFKSEGF